MSTRSQLTKDLNESVKALLGKHVKILHKNVVKLETKGDKTENRVLVFSPCRLFLLTAKVPTKIESHFHYLEIQAVESKKSNQLCLTVGDKQYSFLTADDSDSHDVDSMIKALTAAIRNIFPTVPLQHVIRRIEVASESRNQYLQDSHSDGRATAIGPCGGFSTQYACMCDYHNMPYREEVSWDVDTIYLSHDTRELCLRDFDHLDPKDIVPIISALEYNTWFTKLTASNMKLTHEALDRLLHILKKTLSLEELYLDNLGVKWDFAHKLSLALIANSNSPLHTLDLSNNLIEDKGASSLCGIIAKIMQGANQLSSPLGKLPKGLVHLNLSHCGLSSKGVNQLAHALSVNKLVPSTLSYLNLSGNNLKEEINNLCNFLAQPNSLTHLDLSGTDTVLESLLTRLQEAVQCKEEAGNPIDIKLRQVSDELHAVIVEYLQNSLESMMKCAQEQCPRVLSDEHVRAEILKLCREKNRLSSDFVHSCVVERAGTEIVNRINELNLAVAARVSDRITDEVIESLSRSYKILVGDTNEKRSSTPDVLRTRSRVSSGSSRNDPSETFSTADTVSQHSDQSPMATPHLSTKRKSLHGRKLRPKSVVDSIEGLSADDIPDLLPPLLCSEREALDCGPLRLRHLVKGRPRRAKTRAPTRPVLRPSEITDIDGLGLSEGLDTFFRPGSTTPLVSPVSDDSSHTFPSDVSPNRTPLIKDELNYHESKVSSFETARSVRIIPEMSRSLTEDDARTEARLGRSSPLPKAVSGLLEPCVASPPAQSQSTDGLERQSPMAGRRSQGDSPLSASPLALCRRLAQSSDAEQICGVGQCVKEENDGTMQDGLESHSGIGRPYRSRAGTGPEVRKRTCSNQDVDAEKPPSPIVAPGVKQRSTGLVESLRSPTDSFPKGTTADGLKSPVLKSTTKDASLRTNDSTTCCGGKQCNSRQKSLPPIAPKPRPLSVLGGDRKSGEFSLLSDGSSTNTSAANTPDLDSGDTLDESTDSGVASLGSGGGCSAGTTVGEKRSVRELAACLDRQGAGGRTGSSHSTESEHVPLPLSCMTGSEAAAHSRHLTHLTRKSDGDGQSSTEVKEVLESLVEDNGFLERKVEIVPSRKKRESYVVNSQYAFDEDVIDV